MAGLLDYLTQAADSSKRRIKGLIADPMGQLGLLADRGVENVNARLQKNMGKPYNLTYNKAYQDAMEEAAFNALTVYHGSPHKFTKFDMSKVGTGEGAQTYGHGLYFAESPDVAKYYQNTVQTRLNNDDIISSLNNEINKKYKNVRGDVFGAKVLDELLLSKNSDPKLVEQIDNRLNHFAGPKFQVENMRNNYGIKSPEYKKAKKTLDAMLALRDDISNGTVKRLHEPNYFYKVDIPDEAIPRMLDWDKPLIEQSKEVQGAINSIVEAEELYKGYSPFMGLSKRPMAEGIEFLNKKLGSPDITSRYLKDAGIPGIRYLDGNSRGAGAGSYNYVLFDDQLPRILEVNGVPTGLKPWADDLANAPKRKK